MLVGVHKTLTLPRVIIALDVETSDWDEHCSFRRMDEHFHNGVPCQSDHHGDAGHICGFGYCVFERVYHEANMYVADKPVSLVIKLPKGQTIAQKASDVHGITTDACEKGTEFSVVLQTIITMLKEGAEICCHNVAHESLVFCREIQKRTKLSVLTLTEEDISLFLRSLYKGHCTLILGKQRNNGYYKKLTDELRSCFPIEFRAQSIHDPGEDAYKCARLLLHYHEAFLVKSSDREIAESSIKRARIRLP